MKLLRHAMFIGGIASLTLGGNVPLVVAQTTTQIRSCVATKNGAIRIIGTSDSCKQGESLLIWNTQGLPGPKGEPGAAGIANVGSITAAVMSACGPVVGTQVYIPGQSFLAKTGTPVTFVLQHVPAGSYTVVLEVPNQTPAVVSNVLVTAGQSTDLGTLAVPDLQSDPSNCGQCGKTCDSGFTCTDGQCQPLPGVCGNGVVDPGEQCDPPGSLCSTGPALYCGTDCSACISCEDNNPCTNDVIVGNVCTHQTLTGPHCPGGACFQGSCIPSEP